MTRQHHCQVQSHSALPATKECDHLVADNRIVVKEGRHCLSFIEAFSFLFFFFCIVFIVNVIEDELTSLYYHRTCQHFCGLWCSEWANTEHLCTLCFCLGIKDVSDCKQVQKMTRGAKCFLNIRCLLLQPILHSGPNLLKHHHKYFPWGNWCSIHSQRTSQLTS